jgi:UbiD family decarboxylase
MRRDICHRRVLTAWIETLDKTGLLARYSEEMRADELPTIMEENPDKAVYVEKVKDCAFPFLANAYGVRPMYALALDCDIKKVGITIAERSSQRQKPEFVKTAPCKDVILNGDDIDLTIFPLFHHHPKDGHAYFNDTNVVSRDPDTGLIDQGIYRFMYRSKNETNIDMRNHTHGARIHAKRYQQLGKDMPIAVIIGGPTLDKIASMVSFPGVDDRDILGGFCGEPAKLVKCETNDLTVPANAEIVIEGRGLQERTGLETNSSGAIALGLPEMICSRSPSYCTRSAISRSRLTNCRTFPGSQLG